MRDAVHHDFERNRDLLLDLLGRDPGPLRDDLDVVVGHVRIRFDRQIVERDRAPDEQQHGERQDQKPVVQRKIDKAANHFLLLLHRVLQHQGVGHHLRRRA